jgi:hypothetical protein
MGIKSQITAAAILTLAIAGCTSGETPPEATNTANPVPTPQAAVQKPPANPSFPNPVVSAKPNPTVAANDRGLIESTKGDLRADLVPKGRPDPFAQIVGQAVPQMSDSSVPKVVPKLPPLPIAPIQPQANPNTPRQPQTNLPPIAQQSRPNQNPKAALLPKPKPAFNSPLPKVLPQVLAKAPIAPLLPPQPQPDAAKAVLVSGVVLIGKEPQAIIKVLDEPTSRYVQAGQRLGNGVLIKRIEMNRGSNPIVILEQYGIEVAKGVGEKPTSTEPSKTASAGNSISMVTPL